MLSQGELADLLGVNQAQISRYEHNEEAPPLSAVLGFQVIFDRSSRTMFQQHYDLVEDAVMRRAAMFERKLLGKQDHASAKKRQLLEGMMARATNRGGV